MVETRIQNEPELNRMESLEINSFGSNLQQDNSNQEAANSDQSDSMSERAIKQMDSPLSMENEVTSQRSGVDEKPVIMNFGLQTLQNL